MALLQSLERPEEWSWGFPEEEILPVNSSLPVPHAQEFQPALPDLLPYRCRTCLAGPFNHVRRLIPAINLFSPTGSVSLVEP